MRFSRAFISCLVLAFLLYSDAGERPSLFVDIAILGDVMLGRGVAQAHTSGDWDSALAEISPELTTADLALANLESPITPAPLVREAYDLRAPDQSVDALTSSGVDLLSLANNHSLDCGLVGLEATRSVLQANHLMPLGPLPEVARLQVNHHYVSVIALDDVSSPIDMYQVVAAVKAARRSSDWVIVTIHWGAEYSPGPSPRQSLLARQLAEAGADLIVGHHPHVLQPVEWIDVSGENRSSFVAYSLGNALFDQPTPPDARLGVLLLVRLEPSGVGAVTPVPFAIDWPQGRIRQASQEESTSILHRLAITY